MKAPNLVVCILLWFVSFFGLIISIVIGFAWGFVRILVNSIKTKTNPFTPMRKILWKSSIANDQTIGIQAQYFLNDVFVRPGATKRFGDNENETMSHVFGWIDNEQKLYEAGEIVRDALNKIDKEHTKKAKDNPQ